MAFEIFDFGSSVKVSKKFLQSGEMVTHMKPVMETIADDMMRIVSLVFKADGRRGGGSWPKLKPGTVLKKGDTQILRTEYARYGYSSIGGNALYRSLTERDAPMQVLLINDYEIEFGTDRPYAGAHQYGAPSRNIPMRPFLKFTNADVDGWSVAIRDWAMQPFAE